MAMLSQIVRSEVLQASSRLSDEKQCRSTMMGTWFCRSLNSSPKTGPGLLESDGSNTGPVEPFQFCS